MFTCISGKTQTLDDEREEGRVRGTQKAATKSLTAQIKDMVIKVSNSLHIKPHIVRTGSSMCTSEEAKYPYMVDVSASPTPSLNFGGLNQHDGPFGTRLVGSSNSTSNQTPRHESSSIRGCGGFQNTSSATLSSSSSIISESREWRAEIEEGVHMIFVSLPSGGNELVKIQFSLDIFSRRQAQRWWYENQNKIIQLYDVRRIHGQYLNFTPPPIQHDEIEKNPREAP